MKRICIHCSKNGEHILRFWNSFYDNSEYVIEYSQGTFSDCDIFVAMAEGGYNNVRFMTNAPIRICFTGEPECIYRYSKDFLQQFTHIVTSQNIEHIVPTKVKVYKIQQCLYPLIGLKNGVFDENEVRTTLNQSIASNKTKLISAIVSNKCFTQLHRKRRIFLERLKNDIPQLDIFGSGTCNALPAKDFALRDYKFSIAIENCQIDDYWTKKLSDCILSECDVIYCGCKNIQKYFSNITTIDIDNYEEAIALIRKKISDDVDINAVISRKNNMMKHYMLIPTIEKILC